MSGLGFDVDPSVIGVNSVNNKFLLLCILFAPHIVSNTSTITSSSLAMVAFICSKDSKSS